MDIENKNYSKIARKTGNLLKTLTFRKKYYIIIHNCKQYKIVHRLDRDINLFYRINMLEKKR